MKEILKHYIPHKLVMASETGDDRFPLLKRKKTGEETLFFCVKTTHVTNRFLRFQNCNSL
ncbi:MAG: hypothetical protein M3352_01730 [Bacteroidota bacterium]|nr:hypothetical protein [Bacteroidota bacterium]